MSATPSQVLLARNATVSQPQTEAAFISASARSYSNVQFKSTDPLQDRIPPRLEIHPTFCPNSDHPGTVLIKVQGYDFYVHRELLIFASSFFECLLSGSWRETQSETSTWPGDRRMSTSSPAKTPMHSPDIATSYEGSSTSVDTVSAGHDSAKIVRAADALETDSLPSSIDLPRMSDPTPAYLPPPTLEAPPAHLSAVRPARVQSPHQLEPRNDRQAFFDRRQQTQATLLDRADQWTVASDSRTSFVQQMHDYGVECEPPDDQNEGSASVDQYIDHKPHVKVVARIHLRDEEAAPFHDLLAFIYPHLDMQVSWQNAAALLEMSSKFDMPFLRRHCISFLLSSCAGKPIIALKIAEDFELADIYREASKFVLDNFTHWEPAELEVLSEKTLLKLERKRNWFLERLLKLGLTNQARDYTCVSSCPDPQLCAKMVDEKWRTAWASAFRFGLAQPSIIYRSLRLLEPSLSSPAIHLPQIACQSHAKLYVADLFDRMFGFGMSQLSGTFSRTIHASSRPNIENFPARAKYFLCIEMGDHA